MYSILYVDDEEALLEVGKLFLENDGSMAVETLTSARAALDRIAESRFDAVISDYQMPDMDGIAFLQAVRARFDNLPFILFTGRGREEVVIEAINSGADFYLQKGGSPDSQFAELAHKVRMAVARREAQEALRRETRFTQAIFDSVPGILYVYDSSGRLVRWNRNHELVTGYSAEELKGKYMLDWFPDAADRTIVRGIIDRTNRDGQASGEASLTTRSGVRIPFFFTARKMEIGGSMYYTGIGIDITERRRAEQALLSSENMFRGISERSSDLIYVEDEEGRITYVSPSVTRILGYTPDEVIGRPGDQFVLDEDLPRIRSGRLTKRKGGSFENFEIRVRRKDGSIGTLDLQAIPVIRDGTFAGLQTIARDVTGRQEAERALAESEERYRILTDHSRDGVFLEQDGRMVYSSRSFARMTGFPLAEITGKTIGGLIAPEDQPRIMDLYTRCIAGEPIPESLEFSLLHADGSTRVPVAVLVGFCTYHNRLASIGSVRDISVERRQTRALQESEELYRTLADSLPDHVIVHRNGTILYANRLAAEVTGIAQDDLAGRSIFEFVAPESREPVRQMMLARTGGAATGWYEVQVQPRPGIIATALVHSTEIPFRGETAVLIVMTEITTRKQMEASLRESEERFRVLTEHSLDTIMLFDRDLRHLYVNPVVEREYGIPPSDFIGKTHRGMGFPDALVGTWESALTGVFATGNPDEIEFQLSNGEWISWLLVPVHGADGSVDQVLTSARVITKMKRVEETLRRANRQINLLTAITRHDIVNQILVIRAYVELARQKVPDAGLGEYFRKLDTAAETIRSQIEFTRIYGDIGSCRPQWLDIRKVLAEQPVPEGLHLVNDLPPVEIFADPMLGRVFFNLLENAVRHGGTPITVHATASEVEGGYTIVIRDDGCGIGAPDKKRIFERGYGRNTGLGLFLAREILAITGIAIRETGPEGTGARFEIVVPKAGYRFSGRRD